MGVNIHDTVEKINPSSRASSLQGKPSSEVDFSYKFTGVNKVDFYYWVKPVYPVLLILALGSIFFALGRLSANNADKTPLNIQYGNEALVIAGNSSTTSTKTESVKAGSSQKTEIAIPVVKTDGGVIGSKSGKKYYFPWCGTVKRIKPENQVHFVSIEEAKKAGFTAGGNCKGLW